MKIVKLVSENVKRLTAVAIEPGEGALVTIGGKNGAGKSSVLDSIAYALGGKELIPAVPIRAGEREARVMVDLGDVVVTRTFRRDIVACATCGHNAENHSKAGGYGCQVQVDPEGELCPCALLVPVWGETRSSLTVKNKEGAVYPSPQAMLDKLLGRLTFDPLAFARQAQEEPRRAAETLRKLTNLDFAPLEARRKALFDERTLANRTAKAIEGQLAGMARHEGVPAEVIGNDAVQAELEAAEHLRRQAQTKNAAAREADRSFIELSTIQSGEEKELEALKAQVARLEQRIASRHDELKSAIERRALALTEAELAMRLVPDVAAINARLAEIAVTNQRVRENAQYAERLEQLARAEAEAERLTDEIAALDAQKAAALAAAPFPISGLGLGDEGVLFGGVPLEQASSSEQLRVSVAIGLALNPSLKVLLVRNGNLLDEDGIAALAEMAAAAGAQVWMEFVTADAAGVTVMIEDGHAR